MHKNRVRNSLKFSFLDGVFASGMTGLTSDYITPYALILKATSLHIGFLSAMPNLSSALVQLYSADIVDRFKSRKKVINLFVFLHLLMFIPIMLVPYIFSKPVIFLIIFITLLNSFNAIALPAWGSLISEYIPAKSRGKYFGWRNKILTIITVFFSFVSGFILHIFRDNVLRGFLIILILAFTFRFLSWYFLTKMYEPPYKLKEDAYFSFFDFIKRLKVSNFVKFVLFVALLHFCVNIASPFFSVFMIRDLKFNYIIYTILVTTVPIFNILTINRWGRLADRVGNLKILKITSLLIASLPFWWIINQNPIFLILIQGLSGFAWAGFNLSTTNFIYDAVSPPKRTRCIAYFNVFVGLASCLGAFLGGYLVNINILPPLFGYRILSLFFIASILRFLVAFFFPKKIREIRDVEKINRKDLFFNIIGVKPNLLGINRDLRDIFKKEK